MKILTWNISQGGGLRIDKIIHRIIENKPDLLIITEYRNYDKVWKLGKHC
jgi:hypothetical protein